MPISKSAKKAYASSERKRARNLLLEKDLKKTLKKVDAANVNETISKIDKAAKTHLISRHRADRLKSRLAKNFGTPAKKKTVAEKPVAKSKAKSKNVKLNPKRK